MVEKSPLPKIHVILRSLVELQYKAITPSAVGSQIMCTLFCSIRNRQKNNVVLVLIRQAQGKLFAALYTLHLKRFRMWRVLQVKMVQVRTYVQVSIQVHEHGVSPFLTIFYTSYTSTSIAIHKKNLKQNLLFIYCPLYYLQNPIV